MKIVYRMLLVLHLIVGIGAVFGGIGTISNPKAPLGVSLDLLKNSPFNDFLIPGIILFTVIGLGNLAGATAVLLKAKYQAYISSVFTWALVIWIVVQCVMINAVAFLHVLFFIIGVVGAGLSATILFKQRLFPTNIILNLYKRVTGKEA